MTLRQAITEVLRKRSWEYTYVIRNTLSMNLPHIAWETAPFPKATCRQVRDELYRMQRDGFVKTVPGKSPAYIAWALVRTDLPPHLRPE